MIERFQPSASQLESLNDAAYQEFARLTMAMLQETEARFDIPDITAMSPDELATWLETQQLQVEREYEAAVDDLLAGGDIRTWEETVIELVIGAALLALLFGFGGVGGLRSQRASRALVRQARDTITGQLAAIRTTAEKMRQGILTPAQIKAARYRRASAIKESYERGRIVDAIANKGHNEGTRRLNSAHPCRDCPNYQQLTWVPITQIVPIATYCVCQNRCLCTIKTRFNPDRFVDDINNGRGENLVKAYDLAMEERRIEFLSRHGWLK